jgi:enoyl-CoA hydratase/carnithine racemase
MSDYVRVTRDDDGVATIRLDNPKVNALTNALLEQLREAAQTLTDDPPGAVVVTGGERIFAAGADITEFAGPDEARAIGRTFIEALDALAGIPRVVIAAVAGYALGGGCEVALACDLRVAADTAVFGLPEIQLGIIPGGGGTQRLPRLIGASRAKAMVLSGRQVKAPEALAIGLADEVVPVAELADRAHALAAQYARGALAAQALAKQAIDRGLDGPLAAGLEIEHEAFVETFTTDDSRIGIASFLEHGPGKATFAGR